MATIKTSKATRSNTRFTNGPDLIVGTERNDTLNGGDGNDTMKGAGGNDRVIGDKGDDKMYGDAGNDTLVWNNGDGSDYMYGGAGIDTVEINDAAAAGDDFVLKAQGNVAVFDRINLGKFTVKSKQSEIFQINASGGDDRLTVNSLAGTDVRLINFFGGAGNDTLEAAASTVNIFASGGAGNDILKSGLGKDTLSGGEGDDSLVGGKELDVMLGGGGNDRLVWNNGDGSDIMNGGSGTADVIEVTDAANAGDSFVINAALNQFANNVTFDRVNLVPFRLTIDDAEQFDVKASGGDDKLEVNSLAGTDFTLVKFAGGEGNDTLDAADTAVAVVALGEAGNDLMIGGAAADNLDGGAGQDTLIGGGGQDTLTGGVDSDTFVYNGNVFANGTPVLNVATGIKTLNTPDILGDFNIAQDKFGLDASDLGIGQINFVKGKSSDIAGPANVIVLTDGFANAAAAANEIAKNDKITGDVGVFSYFNTTLGISRLVFSKDLSDRGDISVLSNLTNQTNVGNQNQFSVNNFSLV
ncbi:MAG: calcium-binding protein [Cyanobacteria bacterium CRU_2_1]|nr:calcium-binding protein [Cyanobacteria bacterium RU_5_0]NJR61309.1 calcium-binding protein [Cyanobacteria bacterium CRU_2_1]